MDDYVDSFLSLQSWSELNTSSRSSWTGSSVSHANDVLADTVEAYVEDKNNTSICMIPSAHFIENVNSEDSDLHAHSDNSSAFAGGTLNYLSQPENETRGSNMLLNGVFESNSISGSYNQDLNTLTMTSSVESNASDACKFAQPLRDANSISSVPSMWPPSYSGVSSIAEQVKLQGFDFQGIENNGDTLTKSYAENGNYSYVNSSAASLHDCNELNSSNLPPFIGQQIQMMNGCLQPHEQEQNGMHSLQLPTLSSGFPIMSGKPAGLHAQQQLSLSTEANSLKHQTNHSSTAQEHTTTANTNGTAKPRVRARRGQATDPHSIAERLRREKIADRMKNLQELVPNSNKTDKASMLDEIIDYVKFLQLQVKVLSMSRLGAAGAVLPLITDVQAEGSALLLSESEENIALEQEVVKLMELSVTTAMQYLQNKGLCLMPIALASAISSRKGSSSAAILQGRRKPDGNNLISSERISRENGSHNMFSGGSGMKREEVVKSI